jgi:hypothetical protein
MKGALKARRSGGVGGAKKGLALDGETDVKQIGKVAKKSNNMP